jgi:hypothetical protein
MNEHHRDLYRGVNEFKKCYKPRSNLIGDENGDLLTDSHNILNRWKNCFYQLLNVLGVTDVRQIEIHAAKPLVSEPSAVGFEIGVVKLKNYKSSCSDQILAELFQAGSETLWSEIHKFFKYVWSKEELPEQWKKSVVAVHKKGDSACCSNY